MMMPAVLNAARIAGAQWPIGIGFATQRARSRIYTPKAQPGATVNRSGVHGIHDGERKRKMEDDGGTIRQDYCR